MGCTACTEPQCLYKGAPLSLPYYFISWWINKILVITVYSLYQKWKFVLLKIEESYSLFWRHISNLNFFSGTEVSDATVPVSRCHSDLGVWDYTSMEISIQCAPFPRKEKKCVGWPEFLMILWLSRRRRGDFNTNTLCVITDLFVYVIEQSTEF